MLIISEIRGKDLENRFLPRFFLLIFCTLCVQNVLGKYPNLLTRFSGHVEQECPSTSKETMQWNTKTEEWKKAVRNVRLQAVLFDSSMRFDKIKKGKEKKQEEGHTVAILLAY